MNLTPAQRKLLEFARDWQSLGDGTIEATIQTGLKGPNQAWVRRSLEKKGLVDASGNITDAGRNALVHRGILPPANNNTPWLTNQEPPRKNPCPACGAEMEFQPKTWEGDPSLPNGTRDIPAEWTCDCGHHQTERPR